MTEVPTQATNADPEELARFNELAAQWWDRAGPMQALHDINPLRLDVISEQIAISGRRALDVGCGGGILAEGLAKAGASVTALDLSHDVLNVARAHSADAGLNIEYLEQPVEALAAERSAHFDLVACMEMLEHVPAPELVIEACAQLLRPGGRAVFSTLNRTPKSFAQAIIGAEYVLGMIPRGTHEYAKFIRPSELARACRQSGLEVVKMRGLGYNPLNRSYALNDDCSVNYFLCALKPR